MILVLRYLHFIGYLRLSDIAKSVGKFDDASAWISKAFAVDEGYSDTVILQGDLFIRNGQLDEAKRCYEKIVQKVSSEVSYF